MTRTAHRAAVAATAFALFAVTACGSGGSTETTAPDEATPAAVDTSTAPPEPTPTTGHPYDTVEELLDALEAAARDMETVRIELDFSAEEQLMTAEADVRYDGREVAMSMTMEVSEMPRPVRLMLVDEIVYVSMPPMTPRGKFVRVDPNDPDDPLAKDMQDFTDLTGQVDPLGGLEQLKDAFKMMEYLGEAAMDGERLHHYQVTADIRAVAAMLGAKPRDLRGLPRRVLFDYWVDDQDLLRQSQFQLGGLVVNTAMSGWGEPVRIKAPSKRQIVSFPDGAA